LKRVKYEIEYVEIENEKPFEKFVLSLTLKERAKIFETINYFIELKSDNLPIKGKLSKQLDGGIFELRTYLRDKIARTLYFYLLPKGCENYYNSWFHKKDSENPK